NRNTLDYNWYLNGTAARPYQTSTALGSSSIKVFPGDVLRVERVNGTIYWKRNGTVVFPTTSSATYTSTTQLLCDVAFQTNGASLSDANLSHTFTNFSATPKQTERRFVYDHAGRQLQ